MTARRSSWVGRLAPAVGVVACVLGSSTAAGATAPPIDTSFLRGQAEAQFLAENPTATQVACAVPSADEPGVQFLCYGATPEGAVIVRQATMNDDGGIVFEAVAAAGSSTTTTSTPPAFEGTGSEVVQVPAITGLTIVAITHDGAGDVTVQPQNAGAAIGTPFVATAATASGRYLVGLDGAVSAFAVTAEGSWTLAVEPATRATALDASTPAAGATPDVVRYADAVASPVTVSFEGTGTIVVTAVTAAGVQPLLDQAGPYDGGLTLPAGPGFVVIDAAGAWTIALGAQPTPPTSAAG